MSKQLLLMLGIVFFFSCEQEEAQPLGNPTQIEQFFPLKDFVENQLVRLDGKEVSKTTRIKGEVEKTVRQLDTEEWRRELHIFIQADINKASLSSSYTTVQEGNVTTHRLKKGEESPIQEIKISYNQDKVSQISFSSLQENIFYQSGSQGTLVMDPSTGILAAYKVRGTQKVWFLRPNEMEVEGEINP